MRDQLITRLEELDAMRDDLVDMLASLRMAMGEEPAKPATTPKAAHRAKPATAPSS